MSSLANPVAWWEQTFEVKWYALRTQYPRHKPFRAFHFEQPFMGWALLYIRTIYPFNNFTLQECNSCTARPLHKIKQSMASGRQTGNSLLLQTLIDGLVVIQGRKTSPTMTTCWFLTVQKTSYRKNCVQPLQPELEVPGATTSLENLGTKYQQIQFGSCK